MPVCTKSEHHGWSEGACAWCEEPTPAVAKYEEPPVSRIGHFLIDPKSGQATFDGKPLFGAPTARFNVARERSHEVPNARSQEMRYTMGVDYSYGPATVVLLGEVLADGADLVEQLVDSLSQTSTEAERMAREMERSAMWLRFSRWLKNPLLYGDL